MRSTPCAQLRAGTPTDSCVPPDMDRSDGPPIPLTCTTQWLGRRRSHKTTRETPSLTSAFELATRCAAPLLAHSLSHSLTHTPSLSSTSNLRAAPNLSLGPCTKLTFPRPAHHVLDGSRRRIVGPWSVILGPDRITRYFHLSTTLPSGPPLSSSSSGAKAWAWLRGHGWALFPLRPTVPTVSPKYWEWPEV